MKIVNSINTLYNSKIEEIELLRKEVDLIISSSKKNSWHYFSRIKSKESLALKLETGRFRDDILDDIFACTIVVENLNEINAAVAKIEEKFVIKHKRPKNENITHKESYSFQFDDLRLYVSIKGTSYMPNNYLNDIIFEIQIKTFLQHAWGIATHDLIYKSNTINWAKERVAYQIKAMLEQAEIAISGAEELAKLKEISKNNTESIKLNEIRNFLVRSFPEESLPADLLRLSGIILSLKNFFRIDLNFIADILQKETEQNRGVTTLNLSPYGIILQSIINQSPKTFEEGFTKKNAKYFKGFYIPNEVDIDSLKLEDTSKIIRLK